MATPIDLDGEIYGDPIVQASVINRPKRTWWGKKIVEVEPTITPLLTDPPTFMVKGEMADMTYTRHGHHIDGTVMTNKPNTVARCGGPGICGPCSIEAAACKPYPEGTMLIWDADAHQFHAPQGQLGCGFCLDESRKPPVVGVARIEPVIPESEWKIGSPENYQAKAIRLVKKHIDKGFIGYSEKPAYEIYVVWFCKTLQNWKALISTTLPDNVYYEVTYNGDKHETYIDVYVKSRNICIPD